MTKGSATCETCPYWQEIKPLLGPRVGHCHHAATERIPFDSTWWCSEHPARQRDRLAAMAMQGFAAIPIRTSAADIAHFAYEIADAMLAERVRE